MKFTTIGKTERVVSQIGLGTWQFGSKGWGYGTDFGKKDAIDIVHKALDLGINLIDTAEVYGGGKSEIIIGEALEGYEREKVVVVSKFLPKTVRPSAVKRSLNNSLKRLKTDYLDIYLIHFPNPLLPLGRTLKYMEEMFDEGVIRHIGISNFGLNRFQKAQNKMTSHRIEVNQLNYSMAKSKVKNKFLPYAQENGITVMAYSPLAQGFLTGKYNAENSPKGTRRTNRIFRKKNFERAVPLFKLLKSISEEHGVTMSQVSINWLIQDKPVVAIPGAKNLQQLESNVQAGDFQLTNDNLNQLTSVINDFTPKMIF
ncbi:MAG: aldo/keto reductase [Candidatus Heimdallarchaeota archaeon]|nr:aldo/keto reductase [Candidatus Heimdallarchaeota archaeon]